MSHAEDTRLLALLVHRGLVSEQHAIAALRQREPMRHLLQNGIVTEAQWREWQRTSAGTRPELSRYELGELLGEGGMARVFAATDRTDGAAVALKVLRPELAKEPIAVERFVREAKLLIEIRHPHVVRGLRVAREGATIFFAMEIVPGHSLQQELDTHGRLDEATALRITAQVASALDELHARCLVHRDVKPGNILWEETRGAVLIDLGFAVPSGQQASGSETTAGTVHYIAPEQARGSGELDARADIYALGATLFHLVTGSLPFAGATGEEVLRKQVLESLSGERIRDLQLSPQLHYFIEKMMAKERENRFQDPQQLQAEIDARLQQLAAEQEREAADHEDRPRLGGHRRRRRH